MPHRLSAAAPRSKHGPSVHPEREREGEKGVEEKLAPVFTQKPLLENRRRASRKGSCGSAGGCRKAECERKTLNRVGATCSRALFS